METSQYIDNIIGTASVPSPELTVLFHPSNKNSGFSKALLNLANAVRQVQRNNSPLIFGDTQKLPSTPALTFRHPDCGEINYMAIPEKQEIAPFREMIAGKLPLNGSLSDDLILRLNTHHYPTEIMVFISSACAYCPQAVRTAMGLTVISRRISVSILDVERVPELVKDYHIQSVPVIVLNREMIINRNPTPSELVELILSCKTDVYDSKVFLSCIETGNIERGVKLLVSDNRFSGFFLTAWGKSTLHLRMGLLFAAELAIEQKQDVLNSVVDGLIKILETQDISLRGDTADLLGRIGHNQARAPLKALLKDDNPDVVEIAQEALENLSSSAFPG